MLADMQMEGRSFCSSQQIRSVFQTQGMKNFDVFLILKDSFAGWLTFFLARAVGVPVVRLETMLVATIFIILFFFFSGFPSPFLFSSVATVSHRRSARIKKLIQQKLFRTLKNLGETPRRTFWGTLAAILDFAGCAALQVVSECSLHHWAGASLIFFIKCHCWKMYKSRCILNLRCKNLVVSCIVEVYFCSKKETRYC